MCVDIGLTSLQIHSSGNKRLASNKRITRVINALSARELFSCAAVCAAEDESPARFDAQLRIVYRERMLPR